MQSGNNKKWIFKRLQAWAGGNCGFCVEMGIRKLSKARANRKMRRNAKQALAKSRPEKNDNS